MEIEHRDGYVIYTETIEERDERRRKHLERVEVLVHLTPGQKAWLRKVASSRRRP